MKSKKKKIIIAIAVLLAIAIAFCGLLALTNNALKNKYKKEYSNNPTVNNYFALMTYLCDVRSLESVDYVPKVFDFSNETLTEYGKIIFTEEQISELNNEEIADLVKTEALVDALIPCITQDEIEQFKKCATDYLPKIDSNYRLCVFWACCQSGDDTEFFNENKELIIDLLYQFEANETDNIEKAKWLTSISAYYYSLMGNDTQSALNIDERISALLEKGQASDEIKQALKEQKQSDITYWDFMFSTPKNAKKAVNSILNDENVQDK